MFSSCTAQKEKIDVSLQEIHSLQKCPLTGAERLNEYLPLLQNKRVALLVNQTSIVTDSAHQVVPLVDILLDKDIDIRFLMAPEHGLKGVISAGDIVGDTRYEKKQNLQVYSLYGENKKPQKEWLDSIDCVVFDIQDVGCRFYTYLSTLYYLLESCAENHKEVILLDRPNPNDTIDGPVLTPEYKSFVGMVEVPLLHGCTLGEMAKMMIGEQWVPECKLTIIPCTGWQHGDNYALPVAPSPNLRTDHAIRIYPSLCLFEATDISVGRGTDWPFEVLGHPDIQGDFSFIPHHCTSASHPLQEGKNCYGFDLRNIDIKKGFHLDWLLECNEQFKNRGKTSSWIKQETFFDRLAGTNTLRIQITSGMTESQIRETWQKDIINYKKIRSKYLIYNE